MKLREEISGFIQLLPQEAEDKLLSIIKKWALEMVGEDSNISYHDVGNVRILHEEMQDSIRWEQGFNKAKQEIRQRIEETTK